MELKMGAFNKDKTVDDYILEPPFFNGEFGLMDTVNRKYPKLRSLFKKLKSLDWSEDEFQFLKCNEDFKKANNGSKLDKDLANLMIDTLAWQWEADSVAANAPIVTVALMQPCSEIWEAESEISKNEIIHANSYSEIVRLSFDNPREVLDSILSKQEQLKRLKVVESSLGEARKQFLLNSVGQSNLSQSELIELAIITYFTIFCLERIQFMASFAVTFTVCDLARAYQPIGECVQKICQDELETHVEIRREILRILKSKYPNEWNNVKPKMVEIFKDVVDSEMLWTDTLFEGKSIPAVDSNVLKQWVLYNAQDVVYECKLENTGYEYPGKNPMPSMKTWMNQALVQVALQEGDSTQYKVGIIDRSSMGSVGSNKL